MYLFIAGLTIGAGATSLFLTVTKGCYPESAPVTFLLILLGVISLVAHFSNIKK